MNNFISKFPLLLLFGEPVSIEAVCAICLTPMVRDDGTLRQNLVATQGLKCDEPAGKEHQWLTHSMVDLCWPEDCFIPIFSAMFEMMVFSWVSQISNPYQLYHPLWFSTCVPKLSLIQSYSIPFARSQEERNWRFWCGCPCKCYFWRGVLDWG